MKKLKATVRSLSISPNPGMVLVTLDSPEFKSLSYLVLELPSDQKLSLGDELVISIDRPIH